MEKMCVMSLKLRRRVTLRVLYRNGSVMLGDIKSDTSPLQFTWDKWFPNQNLMLYSQQGLPYLCLKAVAHRDQLRLPHCPSREKRPCLHSKKEAVPFV